MGTLSLPRMRNGLNVLDHVRCMVRSTCRCLFRSACTNNKSVGWTSFINSLDTVWQLSVAQVSAKKMGKLSCSQVFVIVAVFLAAMVTVRGSNCQYKYTEQPVPNPLCDPYDNGELLVECTVEAPLDAQNVSIEWYLGCAELSNDSDVTIMAQDAYTDTIHRQRSRLMIVNLSDRYAGKYMCKLVEDNQQLLPSDIFILPTLSVLSETSALSSCPLEHVHSREEEKCAELSGNRADLVSLNCTEPLVQLTILDDIIRATPRVPSYPRSPKPQVLPSVPSSTSSPAPVHTTPSVLLTPAPSVPPDIDTPDETAPRPGISSMWLYLVVAVAAVLFIIIIVLASVSVWKCVSQSKNSSIRAGREENGRAKNTTTNGALSDGLRSKTPSHVYDYIPPLGPGDMLEYVLPSSPPPDPPDIPVSDNPAYGVASSLSPLETDLSC